MKLVARAAIAAATVVVASQAMASITFYEGEGFRGRAATVDNAVPNLREIRFNDRAGSVIVDRGRWEVCEHANFQGRCALLRRGNYDSLRSTGLEWQISSVRPAGQRRYDFEPQASVAPVYQYRQRPGERTYEVPVAWSRAVVTQQGSQQRCWVEKQQVPVAAQSSSNAGGAIIGGIVGGILGHQVGKGSGRDAATVAGAVTGAVVGNNVAGGGSSQPGYATQDVQRCENVPTTAAPAYYEVAYNFRGAEHRIQMAAPPGNTIIVNERGEPRM
ncbi:beta/gamma crystallin-related protein [Ramlibacter albus]|uniref:Glycine zipper 2TM domain-containing protein n=1 Tax=Ramlibacter albus TaxID=2079448 RepID=A0A923S217_9BURK|nr:beta/gamma crystallin-related protein [Ramlibacter albus]MBC5764288.1 glycine zipper 2TM domain-containing protein [Ramlibacter albus]